MEMTLQRVQLDPDVTIGRLTTDVDEWGCWTCEDTQRPDGAPKVYGQTAIPLGRYKVIVDYSPHFNRDLPHVLDVPGFEGIRMHPGNKAAETDGCVLPGLDRLDKGVGRSVAAFEILYPKIVRALSAGEDVYLNVTD